MYIRVKSSSRAYKIPVRVEGCSHWNTDTRQEIAQYWDAVAETMREYPVEIVYCLRCGSTRREDEIGWREL